ncbi:class I SAM-dependent methyltransferase [Peribacillus simplex]|uniref:class I SAM-dependent DNA methyltransferase n=1 Tax=Peribacillus simplex TaxID=1478 RepID=UPI0010BF3F16|nr:class I SAM-dependent methyltransferase [Peribacillus simplex]TKH03818.1 class I SAM-dependent methyltransferase [Peribacillus simplex]
MGREFIDLFEEWSKSYDDTVSGHDIEYQEVFKHYDRILDSVTDRAHGHVLEFGVGTGNLTERLLKKGLKVSGIEPSPAMREIAVSKLRGKTEIADGDFIDFPKPEQVDSIVSTYAFHHLTDEEKEKAIANYGKLLNTGGKIVFADTMYQSREAHERAIQDARQAGFHNLANDLQTEYYTTIPFLEKALEANGYKVNFERCNQFVWIMEAEKL